MREHKKARSTAATVGQAKAGAGLSRSSTSTNRSTTSTAGRQIQITDFLRIQAVAVAVEEAILG